MGKDCSENKLIRQREGTTQKGRYMEVLNPDNLELMGFKVRDWMNFAEKFAASVNFFEGKDPKKPKGNWEPFHNASEEIKETIESYGKGEITPQLGLYICFLKLLNFSKEKFNNITKRHLDFYYKEVLQLQKKKAQPDSIYAIFELSKNASEQLLEENTLLNAGKDAKGTTLQYALPDEIVINKAIIASLKNTYVDDNGWYHSNMANSGDGIGGAIENDSNSWLPFGDATRPWAKKGFALASPSLKLAEGNREILISINYDSLVSVANIKNYLTLQYTAESEWVTIEKKDIKEAKTESNKLIFRVLLNEEADAIVNYNKEKHLGKYTTDHPIIKVLFDKETKKAYSFYRSLSKQIVQDILLNTTATYSKNLVVKNDHGQIDSEQPFYPFGTQAKRNSKFRIGAEEWIGKRIKEVSLKMDWKDLPDDLEDHYEHYKKEYLELGVNDVFSKGRKGTTEALVTGDFGDNRFIVTSNYIKGKNSTRTQQLFGSKRKKGFSNFLPDYKVYTPIKSDSYFIELSLNNSFLHEAYAKIYTYFAINKLSLPNLPYAPYAENLKVSITTEERLSKTKKEIELFYEHPFGMSSEKFEDGLKLVPEVNIGGQLFVGIDKAVADQNIQMLFQIEEGSENPDTNLSKNGAKVTWEYLKSDRWEGLKPDYLLKDETDNFLKAGLVALTVPKEFTNNSLFEEDYLWIRATITKSFDAVSKFVNIHTQAVSVVFEDHENSLEHLQAGLPPSTISKLETRLSTIKKVAQPYASFDGLPEESDLDYYRRVSERLRHKQRAITVWDYEHLILQEFNFLHKVKCLNHSTIKRFNVPGKVLLVAVPDIRNQNVYDIFQPKLSQAKLNKVGTFINDLNTLHVTAEVISPDYDEIQVSLEAYFYEGKDPNYYSKVLQNDIAHYLAPWAFDKNQSITFGNAMYASEIINYIEHLDYVDYIKNFEMFHGGKIKTEIIPSNQIKILTSVKPSEHTVKTETKKLCQV